MIKVEVFEGEAIQLEHIHIMYQFYLSTTDKKWGKSYLSEEFFHLIHTTMRNSLMLIMALARPVRPVRSHSREDVQEVEARLVTEHRDGPSSCAITLLRPLAGDSAREVEILLHRLSDLRLGSPSRMRQRFY